MITTLALVVAVVITIGVALLLAGASIARAERPSRRQIHPPNITSVVAVSNAGEASAAATAGAASVRQQTGRGIHHHPPAQGRHGRGERPEMTETSAPRPSPSRAIR